MIATDHRTMPPAPPRQMDSIDGVLLVDKPSGPTSHDIVDRIRRTFGFKKVGHGGTLDPQATGLLVILVGKATRLSSLFMGTDKVYIGTMQLGVATDSGDAQGKVLREADSSSVTREQVEEQMAKLRGDMMQIPPMVSAVKIDGVPLYKMARKGKTVEREPRMIHVYEFVITAFNPPAVSFSLRCTKGTYVRTLCSDIGDALGCGAHLSELRRTLSGEMKIENSLTMDRILKMNRDEIASKLIPTTRFSAWHPPRETSQEPE